ncbi:MAG TPA: 3-deoxy-D-manno-octulosonate 8-phosphate phosphatase [Flavobacteriales bacterium]|jgi:3-deoxy-D-manno-octulosonate 8-phosphate phosphatase (KDO 8-P phosphatase)|nr:HAD hydrolase family protein [Flavobacteriales bacterium]HAW20948.1 3-deoxy-D-manno-octulosonate 8-phosphate phosphatase [Flavobacteriales bacterium]
MTLLHQNIKWLREQDLNLTISDDPTVSEIEALAAKLDCPLSNLIIFNMQAQSLDWQKIKFVFLDVDGVLTEGGMFYTEEGAEFKRFDTKDGMAIKEAMKVGIQFGIISSGINKAVIQNRADMFGIKKVYVGAEPKVKIAETWLQDLGIGWDEVGYLGDDINDLKMFEKVGIAACPSDATNPNKRAASFLLQSKGGHGCVREFMGYIPSLKDKL